MMLLMLGSGFFLLFIGKQELIIGVCIGILLTSFGDIQGSFRHRTFAMFLSVFISGIVLCCVQLAYPFLPVLLIVISMFSFTFSMIAVFGHRGSMFAFSGLLGIVLSLVRHYEGINIVWYALTIMFGGMVYLLVSSIYHLLTRKNQINEQLGHLARLTANYLQYRLQLAEQSKYAEELNEKLLSLQVDVTQKQEDLRTLILSDRKISGKSTTRNQQMHVLIQLIDCMELMVANPSNLQKIKHYNAIDNEIYSTFATITTTIVLRLESIAKQLLDTGNHMLDIPDIRFDKANQSIDKYIRVVGLPEAREGALLMRNLVEYYQAQEKKLDAIDRLLSDVSRQRKLALTKNQQGKFLQKENYSFSTVLDNLSIKSPIFRHALRVSLAMVFAYALGSLLQVEKTYWVLLTVIVIMRPSYGLTKQRSIYRVAGTFIGVIISLFIVQWSTSIYLFVGIAAVSMVFAFSLLQRNYLLSSIAVTLNVIFVFSLIESNLYTVITFRLIDTVIGALVSLFISYIIFPYWEYNSFQDIFIDAIQKNKAYLQAIISQVTTPTADDIDYRLQRKDAFLASSELNASFQRFASDPKSKQKQYQDYYELVVLNHSILSTLANLGNFLQKNKNEDLRVIIKTIGSEIMNEWTAILSFSEQRIETNSSVDQIEEYWSELEEKRNQELDEGKEQISLSFRKELQEVQMVKQEFIWLKTITGSLQEKMNNLLT